MKITLTVMALVLIAGVAVAGETVTLPAPKKSGGPNVLTAIDQRASATQTAFPKNELSREDLATILWAATGKNRDGSKWTVPTGMGRMPYTKIYVTDKNGVYLYDWDTHSLTVVSRENVHGEIPMQAFAKAAPTNIYMVTDSQELTHPANEEWAVLLAGAMSQNVYLAAQGVDVGARLVYSIDRDLTKKAFNLASDDKPLFAIVLGKY